MISKKDLLSLNYKFFKENQYAKPFGTCLFVIDVESEKIYQYFKSASKNEIHCYKSDRIKCMNDIKCFECYSGRVDTNSEFEFLTAEEDALLFLEG